MPSDSGNEQKARLEHQDTPQQELMSVPVQRPYTIERRSYVNGLLEELNELLKRHTDLVSLSSEIQGRIELSERNLVATRDYLKTQMAQTNEEIPGNWEQILARVRYIGARLGDACVEIVRSHSPEGITTQHIEDVLNSGQFRFRSGTPLREINAALTRQPAVKRRNGRWHYQERKEMPTTIPTVLRRN